MENLDPKIVKSYAVQLRGENTQKNRNLAEFENQHLMINKKMEKLDPKTVKSHAVRLRGEDSSLSLITVTISTSA